MIIRAGRTLRGWHIVGHSRRATPRPKRPGRGTSSIRRVRPGPVLDQIGDRWTVLVVLILLSGTQRFGGTPATSHPRLGGNEHAGHRAGYPRS